MNRAPASRETRKPSLLPREHGAYAWMVFPQISSLLLGSVTGASLLLATAVGCAFLIHEPVLVARGRRGPRRVQADGPRARRRAWGLGAAVLVCGTFGLVLSPAPVWRALPPVLLLAGLVVLFTLRGVEKSLGGEVIAALTFAAASVPTALAGGLSEATAWPVAGIWGTVFVLATLAVRVVIDRHKRRRRMPAVLLFGITLVLTVGIVGWSLERGGPGVETAVLPTAAVTLLVLLSGLTPRRLRWMGWSLVAANVATLVVLLVFGV